MESRSGAFFFTGPPFSKRMWSVHRFVRSLWGRQANRTLPSRRGVHSQQSTINCWWSRSRQLVEDRLLLLLDTSNCPHRGVPAWPDSYALTCSASDSAIQLWCALSYSHRCKLWRIALLLLIRHWFLPVLCMCDN